ncbi:MAG: ABC transporter permease [Planctomycetes bacterium]|nr:ABC transporter permease [Planctomycetota bacterium]MCL4729081.1 ABC transporter permease [Planctomycetota bacterium]
MNAAPGLLKRVFLNPLAVREVRQACRSWKLVVFLSLYLLIQGAIFAIWVYAASDRGTFENPTGVGRGLFITMSIVMVAIVMLIFPVFSSTAIASEHEKKSFDLLLLTPLAPWEIALGKFFAAAIQSSLFLIATVPLYAMANLFGGIEPEVFFVTLWALVLLSVLISFIGVYASSLVTRAIPAVLVTYAFAFVLGIVLMVVFLTVAFGSTVGALFAVVKFLIDPNVSEALLYLGVLTVTCAMYCTFLFLSTTNRLKPTSHNKSTNMRLFWTCVALVVPVQVASYYMVARLPTYDMVFGSLITAAVYLTLLLSVPGLAFPAEPPIPSRRVRREMEKASPGLLRAGGVLFFPGSARGVAHFSGIAVAGFGLMLVAAKFCFGALRDRFADKAQLAADYTAAAGIESPMAGFGPLGTILAPAMAPSGLSDADMRSALDLYYGHEFWGYALVCLALLLTLLVCAQITWRVSLSGLSRGVSSVLGGLLIVVWLALPYIAEGMTGSDNEPESAVLAQFSPVHGVRVAAAWGTERGRADMKPGEIGSRHRQRADGLMVRYRVFLATAGVLGLGLLASNLTTHRRVMKMFAQASAQSLQPNPVQVSQQQIETAIRNLSQPVAVQQAAPPPQGQPLTAQGAAPVPPVPGPELPPAGEIKTG